MFSRSGAAPNSKLTGRINALASPLPPQSAAPLAPPDLKMGSVLGGDIKITGADLKISSDGALRIDGDVEGEVHGKDVVIGESGRVTGAVFALQVTVRGHVFGVVFGKKVILQASSHVEGDIHNNAIVIEPGARFDGRCHRLEEAFELATPPKRRS